MKKSHFVIAIGIIALSILTPIFLPRLIENSEAFCDNKFSAGDLLGYIGALFASIITILGLSWTFSDNRRGIKEQGRLDVLPFIGVNVLNKDYRLSFFSNVADIHVESQAISKTQEEQYYIEHRLSTVFFTIEDEKTKATSSLSVEQQDLIKNNGATIEEIAKGVHSLVHKQLIFIPIEMCNVGNGPAVDVRIGLNTISAPRKRFVVPITLSVGEKVYVGIYCEADKRNGPESYNLDVYYRDIFGTNYKQVTKLNISKDMKNGILATFDTETKQEMLTKKEEKALFDMDKEENGGQPQ